MLNPSGGIIRTDEIGELIIEKDKVDPAKLGLSVKKMENSKDVYAHNRHAGASALCMKRRMFIHTKKVMNEKQTRRDRDAV